MFSSWQSQFLTSAHMVHTLLFIIKPTRNSKNFENLLRGHLKRLSESLGYFQSGSTLTGIWRNLHRSNPSYQSWAMLN